MTMLSLGGIRFSINAAAYQSFRRSTQYRWPLLNRFGQRPARQFVGLGDETINLQGVIYPAFRGGPSAVERMRDQAAKGKALAMVSSQGAVLGRWVILSAEETRTVFFPNGTPRKIEFTLSLAHYGTDQRTAVA